MTYSIAVVSLARPQALRKGEGKEKRLMDHSRNYFKARVHPKLTLLRKHFKEDSSLWDTKLSKNHSLTAHFNAKCLFLRALGKLGYEHFL